MSDFSIAVEEAHLPEERIATGTFDLGGKTWNYYRPHDGLVMVLMSTVGRRNATDPQKMAAIIDFFMGVLDDEGFDYVENRLLDPHDQFGYTHLQKILEGMMEKWSENPTRGSSASSSTPGTTGLNSTPTTPTST